MRKHDICQKESATVQTVNQYREFLKTGTRCLQVGYARLACNTRPLKIFRWKNENYPETVLNKNFFPRLTFLSAKFASDVTLFLKILSVGMAIILRHAIS